MCVCAPYLSPRRPERALGPLRLELWAVVSCHMVLGLNPSPQEEQSVLLIPEPSHELRT